MSERSALSYVYSGSFEGLMCCLNEVFASGIEPAEILEGEEPQSLYLTKRVIESADLAARFTESIRKNISAAALYRVKLCFLSCAAEKELCIYRFLRLGFRVGRNVLQYLTHPDAEPLLKSVRCLEREAEAFRGFSRFSEIEGVLVAELSPRNQVLPLLGAHFADRMPDETLFIYDKTHHAYFFHQPGEKVRYGYSEDFTAAQPDETELRYRALWRRFYQAVAIPPRFNPRCQNSNLPKRYRADMTEFSEEAHSLQERLLCGQGFLPREAQEEAEALHRKARKET